MPVQSSCTGMIHLIYMRDSFQYFSTLLLCSLAGLAACQPAAPQEQETSPHQPRLMADSLRQPFAYRLEQPDQIWELPFELREISGLTVAPRGGLFVVQDEHGHVFHVDTGPLSVTDWVRFAGSGDFEGVEWVRDTLWVLRSDGKLYEFSDQDRDNAEDEKYQPELPDKADFEGLGFDPLTDRLLLAPKEPVSWGDYDEDYYRPIFALPRRSPDSVGLWQVLDLRDVRSYLERYAAAEGLTELAESFNPDKKSACKPSAIAVHPHRNEVYLLASVGKILLVYSREGELMHVRDLRALDLEQPEGMAFDRDGNLYLSSEGQGRPARIHWFRQAGND